MKFISFLKDVVTSQSGISSKRVCGLLGCLGVLVYCIVTSKQAPVMIDTIVWCCMGLLGIDSVTGIWKSLIRRMYNKIGEPRFNCLSSPIFGCYIHK